MNKAYVLNLLESDRTIGDVKIGYWDGKKYFADEQFFPGVCNDKYDKRVKIYKTRKGAENAVKKLKDKFPYVRDAEIEDLTNEDSH